MNEKLITQAIEQGSRPLVEAMVQVTVQLDKLARLQMLSVLYDRDEVCRLVGECNELYSKDRAEMQALLAASRQKAPIEELLDARTESSKALAEFTKKHPLIVELVQGSGPRQI